MTPDPSYSSSPADAAPITTSAGRQIAVVFKLQLAEVMLDAEQASAWRGPADELLVSIERRHRWHARDALAYLLSLRLALRLGNQPLH